MNSAFIVAIIASLITVVLFYASGRIPNKYAKTSAQLLSVVLGVLVAGGLSSDNSVANAAGQYYFYIMIAIAIIAKIFGKKTQPEISKN
jgi:hypothetical protein